MWTREEIGSPVGRTSLTKLGRIRFAFATTPVDTTLDRAIRRIVGLTLTTPPIITMNTENRNYKVELAPNLFEPNPCINLLPFEIGEAAGNLACITVSSLGAPQGRDNALWGCLAYVWTILQSFPPLECCLHACIRMENTRVARHQALWKVEAMREIARKSRTSKEVFVDNADGTLAIYGAAAIEGERMDLFRPLISPSSRSFLALLPRGLEPVVRKRRKRPSPGSKRPSPGLQQDGAQRPL